ncbi:D(4) dopamine receptor isoform X1 [Chelonia mydas]|uniref:D(4) dopamine receptor isoform X1 n=1 Tax=Chelonia mydas TaxID=8469 RepID=UPI0018A1E4F1|nr:D(4) dopamine receptor isoform X1 [Chelonia mydas]XP_043405662.1 D(4) dopamine receptor isoform X1 [Chelonia mydas]
MSRPRPELPLGPGGVPRDGRAVMPGSGELGNATAPRGAAPGYNFAALVFGVSLILCVVGGNLLVCLSVCSERALQTATNYFIVSLAVADLLLALLVLPLYVYSEFQGGVWALSTGLCDALMTMDVMLCTASIFNLCAISVDRFIAVSIPLNYSRQQVDLRQLILISTTWIFAFAVATPVIFGLNDVPGRDPTVCQLEDNNYIVYSSICSFFIPCPVMLVLYCAMFQGLKRWEEARRAKLKSSVYVGGRKLCGPPPVMERKQAEIKLQERSLCDRSECSFPRGYMMNSGIQTVSYPHLKYSHPGHKQAKINGRERKAMKVLPVVVGAFLFCWTPFFVVHITRALCKSCTIPSQVISIVTWLGYINSALNPIIYTIFNTEFRKFFRKALHVFC